MRENEIAAFRLDDICGKTNVLVVIREAFAARIYFVANVPDLDELSASLRC